MKNNPFFYLVVLALTFADISMETLVITVAALQYRLVSCCLLNTEFLDSVKLLCQLICISHTVDPCLDDDCLHSISYQGPTRCHISLLEETGFAMVLVCLPVFFQESLTHKQTS